MYSSIYCHFLLNVPSVLSDICQSYFPKCSNAWGYLVPFLLPLKEVGRISLVTADLLFHSCGTAAKSLQSCPTLCDPIGQAPPSLGFSRQEHWSGLPFPSPVHESEKWKWSRSVVSDSLGPHGLQPTRLLCPWDFPGKRTGVGCHCLLCTDAVGIPNSCPPHYHIL